MTHGLAVHRFIDARRRNRVFVAASNAPEDAIQKADYVCDGTDDQVQIADALADLPAGGGIIELSEGDFTCTETGVTGYAIVLKSNVRLTGQGPGSTRITLAAGVADDVQVINAEGFSYVEIDHLEVDGNESRSATTFDALGGGISLAGGDHNYIHHVYVHDCMGDGIDTDDDDELVIDSCIAENNNGNGIFPSSGSAFRATISNCHTTGNAAGRTSRNAGIAVRGEQVMIVNCTSDADEHGFHLEPQGAGSQIDIVGCSVENATDTCYVFGRGTGGTGAGHVNMAACDATTDGLKVLDIQSSFVNISASSFIATDVGGTVVDCVPSSDGSFGTDVRMVNCEIRDTFSGGKSNTLVNLDATNNAVDFRMAHCTITGGDTDSVKTAGGAYVELFDCDIPDTDINIASNNNRFIFNQFGVSPTDTGSGHTWMYNTGYVTENQGSSTQSGDGSTTAFTIAHGCDATPTAFFATAGSADADGDFYVTADATNLTLTYGTAPANGTNNLDWVWRAWVR